MTVLSWSVIASAGLCLGALTALVLRTRAFRAAPVLAAPLGSRIRGIAYAFGAGMLPGAKESARDHLAVWASGMLYHAGIFAGLGYLGLTLAGVHHTVVADMLRVPVFLGVCAGVGLLVRRLTVAHLRALSCPDDYAANLVVDLFLVAALADSMTAAARTPFYLMAVFMFLYIPAGKIRHCVFFFYTRTLFGRFFGYRGVVPHRALHEN